MGIYKVGVVVKYKRGLRDPESEVIYKDLVLKKGYNMVKKVETGKFFLLDVEADSFEEAERIVKEMCEKLRIYNPIVHSLEVFEYGKGSGD
ncbi:MAG: phosphoribosylformylglycinamidine synthase subunit PurS [Desulfurococcaceae archaeon]